MSSDLPCFALQVAAVYPAILQVCHLPCWDHFKQEGLEESNVKPVGKPILWRKKFRARMQHKVGCVR